MPQDPDCPTCDVYSAQVILAELQRSKDNPDFWSTQVRVFLDGLMLFRIAERIQDTQTAQNMRRQAYNEVDHALRLLSESKPQRSPASVSKSTE